MTDPKSFAKLFDHTALKAETTTSDIDRLCTEARRFGFATVCVNGTYVARAARALEGSGVLPITVVGFPLGANRTDVKVFETKRAIDDGAAEIDMVLNVGALLSHDEVLVRQDIEQVVQAAARVPVKVILETCYLSPAQITAATGWCVAAGAAFVKTSTGFGTRGASVEDIHLMRQAADRRIRIKASGGIRTLADVTALVEAGADRIGASASVKIIEELQHSRGSAKS